LYPTVPRTLSGRDAVVQFGAGMFPAFSEIQWGRLTGSAALEFQVQATTQRPSLRQGNGHGQPHYASGVSLFRLSSLR
jgi:hypothetical protein